MIRTLVSIIGVVAAGAVFFLYTKPAYDSVQEVRAQITQYDAALTKATELQSIKQTLLSKYNAFSENDKDKLQKLLPDHVDNVRLILDLDSLASRHGMALQNVVVSTPQTSGGAQTAAGAISASKQKYDSLLMKFSTQGTYQTFLDFLLDLEQSLRIVDLAALKIATGGAAAAGGEPVYTYDLTIRTYWLK
jgi:Tfp pilus assembly protein PilO